MGLPRRQRRTERLGRTSLALPYSSIMTESQVDTVCEQLVRAVEV